jgi:PAS domain S-box-containing protein
MNAHKILIVDDDSITAVFLEDALRRRGYEVTSIAPSGERAIEDIKINKPDLVIMDVTLEGGMDGIETADYIRNNFQLPVIYMSAHAEQSVIDRAKATEPYGYIIKPFTERELEVTLDIAIYKHKTDMLLKKTNDELREKEERLRIITESISEVFWMYDPEIDKMHYVSPAYEHIWGRSVTSLYENPMSSFTDAIHPDDRGRVIATLELEKIGKPFDIEYRIVRPDGAVRWIWDRGVPVLDNNGRITQYSGIARDITRRKVVQRKLQDSEEFLSSIVENIPYMIFVKDAKELRFIRFNKAGERLLGYGRDALVGKNDYDFFPKGEADFFTGQDMDVIVSKKPVDIPEEIIKTRFLGERVLHTKKMPILDGEGNTRYLLGISEDITDRKRELKELMEAKEAAVAANSVKSDFLANMSHELRTPLNSIIGFSEILEDELPGSLNEQQHENIRYILKAGRHLLSLINDILDLAKVESGKMEMEFESVSLRELLEQSLVMHRERALRNGVSLSIEMPPDRETRKTSTEISIEADERKLKQILFNLIGNAVKFTPRGGLVSVVARKPADKDEIEIGVIDTGIGISPDDIPKLFKEFSQLESVSSKKYEGTGLGLALSKKLVELHNGRIWVESAVGKGSNFTFTIPVGQPRTEDIG